MRLAILSLTVLAVLAGCTDDPASTQEAATPDDTSGAAEAAPRDPAPITGSWHLDGAGVVFVAFVASVSSEQYMDFDIDRSGETTITSSWECLSGPVCALRLYVYDGDEPVAEASGAGPLQITTDLEAGSYQLVMYPMYEGSVAIQAKGTFTVETS